MSHRRRRFCRLHASLWQILKSARRHSKWQNEASSGRDVAIAVAEHRFGQKLLEPAGKIPQADAEEQYYVRLDEARMATYLNPNGIRQARGG